LPNTLGDETLNPVALAADREWTHLDTIVERITDNDLGEVGRERVNQFVVAAPRDHDAGEGGTHLTCQETLGTGKHGRRRGDVGVVQDHCCRFAAEFEREPGDALTADRTDCATRRR